MIRIQREAFDPGQELHHFTKACCGAGAIATFLGLVRDYNADGALRGMSLEHYPGMTEKELAKIAEQATTRWALTDVKVIHRYGDLLPDEPIVFVAAASTHRADALEACAFIIDILKTSAPFWKREVAEDGRQMWVDARDGDMHRARAWGDQ